MKIIKKNEMVAVYGVVLEEAASSLTKGVSPQGTMENTANYYTN